MLKARMREPLHVWEHKPRLGVELDPAEISILQRAKAVDIAPSVTAPAAWDVRGRSLVGVIALPERELWLHPKVPTGNLLFLLAYASDPAGWKETLATLDTSLDLVPAIAMAFAVHARHALERGVLQGYVHVEDALPLIRGRVRTTAQMSRRFGLPLPTELSFDDFTADITENRLLLTATRRLLRWPGITSRSRLLLRHVERQLEGVTPLSWGEIPDVLFTRLNLRYRQAIALSRIVLKQRSLTFALGTMQATGLLFDMNRVFEDFVTVALAAPLAALGFVVVPQRREYLDEDRTISLKPDITWWREGSCRGVADAKYKSLVFQELPNADVYQMLAYCIGHRLGRGFLIYAAGNEPQAVHRIRHLGTVVEVLTLDLSSRPGEVLAQVSNLAVMLASSSRHSRAS
jgi:5-methylcytosine-specific restriction enzyme subunit McrC